jgi:hypothetical protein
LNRARSLRSARQQRLPLVSRRARIAGRPGFVHPSDHVERLDAMRAVQTADHARISAPEGESNRRIGGEGRQYGHSAAWKLPRRPIAEPIELEL